MKKKKYLFLAGYFVVIGAIAAGIYVNSPKELTNTASQPEEIELTLVAADRDITWNSVTDYVITQFEEANPGIKIKKRVDEKEVLYETYLRRLASTGQMGDIVEIRNTDYFSAGYMAPLPTELTDLVEAKYKEGDSVYGVNYDISMTGVIYNKKIFRQLGLTVPDTYDDFLDLCRELKKKGYQPVIVGGGNPWHMKHWINQFYINDIILKEPLWEKKLQEGLVSWEDEKVRTMMLHIHELFDNYVQEEWQTDKDSQMPIKMAQGKSAMLLGGPWYFTEIYKQNPSIELGWFLLPDEDGKTCARVIDTNYFGITKECAQDEERFLSAVKFLEFFFSQDIYSYVCRQMKSMPNLSQELTADLSQIELEMRTSLQTSDHKTTSAIDDAVLPADFQSSMIAIVTSLLKDEITVDQALIRCEESYWREYFLEQPEG